MATVEPPLTIPQEELDALQEAIDRAARGTRDLKAAQCM